MFTAVEKTGSRRLSPRLRGIMLLWVAFTFLLVSVGHLAVCVHLSPSLGKNVEVSSASHQHGDGALKDLVCERCPACCGSVQPFKSGKLVSDEGGGTLWPVVAGNSAIRAGPDTPPPKHLA